MSAPAASHSSVAKEIEAEREKARVAAFWEAIDFLIGSGFAEAGAALEYAAFNPAADEQEPS